MIKTDKCPHCGVKREYGMYKPGPFGKPYPALRCNTEGCMWFGKWRRIKKGGGIDGIERFLATQAIQEGHG